MCGGKDETCQSYRKRSSVRGVVSGAPGCVETYRDCRRKVWQLYECYKEEYCDAKIISKMDSV